MAADIYNKDRDITPNYIATVTSWIEKAGEVLVVMRYLRGGGAKDYALIDTPGDFHRLVEVCPRGTDIIVFRDPQLPLRGQVDDDFIQQAQLLIPEGADYLYVCTSPQTVGDPRLNGGLGDRHSTLIEDLDYVRGEKVAVGLCPPFFGTDNDAMISASKDGIDGPR